MPTTPRGYPHPPAQGGTNNVPVDIKALADVCDARPGVAVLTTAERDALPGAELWNWRVIANRTTGRLEQFDLVAGVWRPAVDIDPANIDAKTLGGLGSTSFLRATGKAADSDKLNGSESSTAATAGTVAVRTTGGRLVVGTPSGATDATTKAYADALGVSAAVANAIARRDGAGCLAVAAPSAAGDAATKGYVDAADASAVTAANTDYVARTSVGFGFIDANESTTASADFADLATVGPDAPVTIGPSGMALVMLSVSQVSSVAGQFIGAAVAVSGATTVPANLILSTAATPANTGDTVATRTYMQVGLTPGVHTFRVRYRGAGGNTATFLRRSLIVIPL